MNTELTPMPQHPFFKPSNYPVINGADLQEICIEPQLNDVQNMISTLAQTMANVPKTTPENKKKITDVLNNIFNTITASKKIHKEAGYTKYCYISLYQLNHLFQNSTIDKTLKLSEIETLINEKQTCGSGVIINIRKSIDKMTILQTIAAPRVYSSITHSCFALARHYFEHNLPQLFQQEKGNHIHYVNVLFNFVCPLFGISEIHDSKLYNTLPNINYHFTKFNSIVVKKINPIWFIHQLFNILFDQLSNARNTFQHAIKNQEWFELESLNAESYQALNHIIDILEENLKLFNIHCKIPLNDEEKRLPFLKQKIENDTRYYSLKGMPCYLLLHIMHTLYPENNIKQKPLNNMIKLKNDLIYALEHDGKSHLISFNLLLKYQKKIYALEAYHIKNIFIQALYIEPHIELIYQSIISLTDRLNLVIAEEKDDINILFTEIANYLKKTLEVVDSHLAETSIETMIILDRNNMLLPIFYSSIREKIFAQIDNATFNLLLDNNAIFIYHNIEELTTAQLLMLISKINEQTSSITSPIKIRLLKKILLSQNSELLEALEKNKTLIDCFFSTDIAHLYPVFFQSKKQDPLLLSYIKRMDLTILLSIFQSQSHNPYLNVNNSALLHVLNAISKYIQEEHDKLTKILLLSYPDMTYNILLKNHAILNIFIDKIDRVPPQYIEQITHLINAYMCKKEFCLKIDYPLLLSKKNYIHIILQSAEIIEAFRNVLIHSNIETFTTILNTPLFLDSKMQTSSVYMQIYHIILAPQSIDKEQKLHYCLSQKKINLSLQTLSVISKSKHINDKHKSTIFQSTSILKNIYSSHKKNIDNDTLYFWKDLSLIALHELIHAVIKEINTLKFKVIKKDKHIQLFLNSLLLVETLFPNIKTYQTYLTLLDIIYPKQFIYYAIQKYRFKMIDYQTIFTEVNKSAYFPFYANKNRQALLSLIKSTPNIEEILMNQTYYLYKMCFNGIIKNNELELYLWLIQDILKKNTDLTLINKVLAQHIKEYLQYYPSEKAHLCTMLLDFCKQPTNTDEKKRIHDIINDINKY